MPPNLSDSIVISVTYDCWNTSTCETTRKSSHENPEQARGVSMLSEKELKNLRAISASLGVITFDSYCKNHVLNP